MSLRTITKPMTISYVGEGGGYNYQAEWTFYPVRAWGRPSCAVAYLLPRACLG